MRPVKRTTKLCAALSLPHVRLVTEGWLKACESARAFVDATPHQLTGDHASQPGANSVWSFNAAASRKRASEGAGCLAGHRFYVTPCKQPKTRFSDADLQLIVRCAGGEVVEKPPGAGGGACVVISTEEERGAWAKLARLRGVTVLKAEHLLTCVLRQELDLSAGRLE